VKTLGPLFCNFAYAFVAYDVIAVIGVEKLLTDFYAKQCELDSAPIWHLKIFICCLWTYINFSH